MAVLLSSPDLCRRIDMTGLLTPEAEAANADFMAKYEAAKKRRAEQ